MPPAEPVLILHRSTDGRWCFLQTYNYRAWARVDDVAVCPRDTWLAYLNPQRFLVVTGSHVRLSADSYNPALSELEFGMGDRLPLVSSAETPAVIDGLAVAGHYAVRLPVRGPSGGAGFKLALLPVSSDVATGYLPYTRAIVLRQVFKMEGERYGWGGMLNGRDCSSMIMDLFGSFGFRLPRNADEQAATAGRAVQFGGKPVDRQAQVEKLLPGALLYLPGHIMLYLGEDQGRGYVISDLGSYTSFAGDQPRVVRVHRVAVSDLTIRRGNGKQWLEALETGKQLE